MRNWKPVYYYWYKCLKRGRMPKVIERNRDELEYFLNVARHKKKDEKKPCLPIQPKKHSPKSELRARSYERKKLQRARRFQG